MERIEKSVRYGEEAEAFFEDLFRIAFIASEIKNEAEERGEAKSAHHHKISVVAAKMKLLCFLYDGASRISDERECNEEEPF